MKQILPTIILLIVITANGQTNFNSESNTVTAIDLEKNTFKKDSTANALVIYEYGNSYLDKNSYKLKTEIKKKIKILNKKGFDKANITVRLYNDDDKRKEKISNLVATTYNLINGEVVHVKLNNSAVYTEKYNDNNKLVKFSMPNIKEGSVITYSYTIESPFIYKYKGWKFQSDIPKLYSEYRASIPAIYEYNIKLVGGKKLTTNKSENKKNCLMASNGASADCFNSVYVMKDIPAFIDEDYMTTRDNYLARIDYELKIVRRFDGTIDNITKTWKTTDKELKNDSKIGKQLNKNVSSDDLIDVLIMTEKNDLKKATAIHNYVKENYAWNNKHQLYGDTSIKKLIKEKSGSAAEINILLYNLLNKNKIEVKPVLISTRQNGLPTLVYPVISDFNYLIVQATINNKTYLLDATDSYLNFGELPFKCLNQYGRLLDFKNGSNWIEIVANKTSTILHQINLKINEDNIIKGTINSRYTGYKAISKKKDYYPNPNNYIEQLEDTQEDIEIIEYTQLSKDKNEEDFKESIAIELLNDNAIADKIYFDPFIYKFFTKNPFKLQDRSYPIDFGYKDSFIYVFQIDLEDKYIVEDFPKNINLKLPNDSGNAMLTTEVLENKLKLTFKIIFKQSIYNSNYYESLKKFMSEL